MRQATRSRRGARRAGDGRAAIALLAGDPDLRAKFGQAGREMVTAEFSARQIGAKTVELYDRLLGR